jgi:hypothetical protein
MTVRIKAIWGQTKCPVCEHESQPAELDILENPTAVVLTYKCPCGQDWSDTYEYKERERLN